MTRTSAKTSSAPDLITYRFEGTMAYVKPAENHSKAADYAREAFPHLDGVSESQISFSITVRVQDKIQTVMITPRAWKETMTSLAKFEIVDISVTEPRACTPTSIMLTPPDYAPPPEYSKASEKHADTCYDEKLLSSNCNHPCRSRSRSPSPSSSRRTPIQWLQDQISRVDGN